MKALAVTLALLATCCIPVGAQSRPAGIVGHVINLDNGRPIVGIDVEVYHMPIINVQGPVAKLKTDRTGFFRDITLKPGRYLVVANALGVRSACQISQLYDGVVSSMRMEISSKHERCIGKNVQSSLVVPGQTADVYIIH